MHPTASTTNTAGKSPEQRQPIKKKPNPKPGLAKGNIDFIFLLLVLLLLIIGLVSLFSASHPSAYYLYKDSYNFIFKQAVFAGAGIVIMLVAAGFDYRIQERFVWILYFVTLGLLCIVFLFEPFNDAHRWIIIGTKTRTFFTVQPSEIAKYVLILIFSVLVVRKGKQIKTMMGLLPFMILLAVYAGLIILEPHISGTILIAAIAFLVLFVGGAKIWQLAVYAAAGGALATIVLLLRKTTYAISRIDVWRDPWIDPSDKGLQNIQALYAIASGGSMGVGIGKSAQKHLYLPEPQNDFIFAIVCEEFGFVGAAIIIILFALLVWRGLLIATRCPDRFGSLLAFGLTAQIGLQVVLNIMVVTKMIPNTGISLPFFSAGGTSLIMLLAQMGIILSISKYRKQETKEPIGKGKEVLS